MNKTCLRSKPSKKGKRSQRIASIVVLVMVGFQGALTPLIYAHYQNPKTPIQLEIIFRFYVFCALLMFLFLTFFSYDIAVVMTTPAFYGGADVVIFLVPAILLSNMYIFSPGIGIAKKTHLIIWINVLGGLLNILLNYLLIPRMGITGAGMATMLSCLVIFSAYTVIGQRFYPIPHNWVKIFIAVAFTGALATIVPHLVQNDFLRRALYLAVLCFFPFILIGIGLVRRDELFIAWQIVKRKFSST
jgi:O-antigen/teichoic acid export membrane protein